MYLIERERYDELHAMIARLGRQIEKPMRPGRAPGIIDERVARRGDEEVLPMQLSSIELRTLVAAQIASGLVGQVAPDSPQTRIDEVVQLAVRIAKTLQNASIKSMHEKEAPP
jgi:hypothetical protein